MQDALIAPRAHRPAKPRKIGFSILETRQNQYDRRGSRQADPVTTNPLSLRLADMQKIGWEPWWAQQGLNL